MIHGGFLEQLLNNWRLPCGPVKTRRETLVLLLTVQWGFTPDSFLIVSESPNGADKVIFDNALRYQITDELKARLAHADVEVEIAE